VARRHQQPSATAASMRGNRAYRPCDVDMTATATTFLRDYSMGSLGWLYPEGYLRIRRVPWCLYLHLYRVCAQSLISSSYLSHGGWHEQKTALTPVLERVPRSLWLSLSPSTVFLAVNHSRTVSSLNSSTLRFLDSGSQKMQRTCQTLSYANLDNASTKEISCIGRRPMYKIDEFF
jgi:hypothetical protein